MDKDILKLAKEYEKYNSELPSLRSEYNFLIEDIDRKKSDISIIEKRKKELSENIQIESIKLDEDRIEFERYKEKQENIIKDKFIKWNKELSNLINEEKKEQQILIELRKQYDKDKTEFENYKKQELDKINSEKSIILEEKESILSKTQFLLDKEIELKTLKNEVEQIVATKEKTIELVQENQKKYEYIKEWIKKDTELFLVQKSMIDRKENEVNIKENEVNIKIKDLWDREKDIISKETIIKDKLQQIEEKEYVLKIKEADLVNEEKRLILIAKQQKNV